MIEADCSASRPSTSLTSTARRRRSRRCGCRASIACGRDEARFCTTDRGSTAGAPRPVRSGDECPAYGLEVAMSESEHVQRINTPYPSELHLIRAWWFSRRELDDSPPRRAGTGKVLRTEASCVFDNRTGTATEATTTARAARASPAAAMLPAGPKAVLAGPSRHKPSAGGAGGGAPLWRGWCAVPVPGARAW